MNRPSLRLLTCLSATIVVILLVTHNMTIGLLSSPVQAQVLATALSVSSGNEAQPSALRRQVFLPSVFLAYEAQIGALPHKVFLPLVRTPRATSLFGVEMWKVRADRGLNDVALYSTWVRRNGLRWKDVEPTPTGAFNWDAASVKELEQEMIEASQRDLRLVLIVRANPSWATGGATDCAPIKPEYYAQFARFLAAAVERYSKPPYNVKYWEIGNEPDARQFGVDSPFGCWGQPDDPYYGGRAYGEMLKVVYPAMKAANPAVQVLNGGLLLGMRSEAAAWAPGAGRFMEGVLVAGAGNSFDILNYHSYHNYDAGTRTPDGSGGPRDWKISYLSALMAKYGVANKPLFNTERALLCRASVTAAQCREPQADYVPRMYARGMRDGLTGLIWYQYDSDNFHRTGLVHSVNPLTVKRPAYYAYQQAAKMLGGAKYTGQWLPPQVPAGVEAYQFTRGTVTLAVVWSNTAMLVNIPAGDATSVSCSNRDGAPIACSITGAAPNRYVTITAESGAKYIVMH